MNIFTNYLFVTNGIHRVAVPAMALICLPIHLNADEVNFAPPIEIDASYKGGTDVYAADMDGDGLLDVLGSAETDRELTWWRNPGVAGASWTRVVVKSGFQGASAVYAADIDGDGDMDVLGTGGISGQIGWWENPGGALALTPNWSEKVVSPALLNGASDVFPADVDGDGAIDVVACSSLNGTVVWYGNPGGDAKGVWTETILTDGQFVGNKVNGAAGVRALDFDADGDMDLAAVGINSARVWLNPGDPALVLAPARWVTAPLVGSFNGSSSLKVSDVNNDGFPDLVISLGASNYLLWLERLDSPRIDAWRRTEFTIPSTHKFIGASDITTADLDGDGDVDLIGTAGTTNELAWLDNPGGELINASAQWTKRVIDDRLLGAGALHAADIDGDGDRDLVALGSTNNRVLVYLNESGIPASGEFAISEIEPLGEADGLNGYRLTWNSIGGVEYAVQASDDQETWTDVVAVPSGGSETTVGVTVASGTPQQYWRAVLPPQ